MIEYVINQSGSDLYNGSKASNLIKPTDANDLTPGHLGLLGFKEEAAGKLRVFAMVDVITQSILDPLHQFLFSCFKKFPNDGTHDQHASFSRALVKAQKYNCSYGYDLSSATDRLPIAVQKTLLNSIFQSNLGDLWASILVDRGYSVPLSTKSRTGFAYEIPSEIVKDGGLRYSVGQPMGALSS